HGAIRGQADRRRRRPAGVRPARPRPRDRGATGRRAGAWRDSVLGPERGVARHRQRIPPPRRARFRGATPPGCAPRHRRGRYPLVIQTHGFDSTAFAPDGVFPTANAAQPMVAQGMLVLQVGAGDHATAIADVLTPQEAPHAMEEIEGAIDHLYSLGLIDRARVGVIGFSRTCFHVLYTLTHSKYPIAAAAITDGVDFSYLQYMFFQNVQLAWGHTLDEYGGVNGGP